MKGIKHDFGKRQWHLLPMAALDPIVRVLEFGAAKYEPDGWKSVPDPVTRYYNALQRHLIAWRSGEVNDPESGEHHLAHAGCCLVFLLWFEATVHIAKPRVLDLKLPEGWNDPRQGPRETDGREPEMTDDMQDDMQDGSRVIGYVPRDSDGRECGERLDAMADVMNFQRGYVDGRSETDEEFRERIKSGLTKLPREDVGFALTDAETAEADRAVKYMPRDGAGFDGPYTQVIETALALETVVRDAGNALVGKVSVGVLDILSHHAAKLRAYAAREFARLEPKTTG